MPDLGKAVYETRLKNKQFKAGMRDTEREADRGLSRIRSHFDKTDRSIDKTDKKTRRLSGSMARANIATRFFANTIKLLKWPAIITGVGLAAQAVGALTAGVLALTASLAPLTGFIVAYPGMLAAVAQGFLAVKLGFKGLSDVMKAKNMDELKEATKGWSDASREAAFTIRGLLKPALKDLQDTARDQVLPKAASALRQVISAQFPVIQKIVRQTSSDFGDFLENAGMAFSSPEWSRDLGIIGRNNRVILNLLGESVINFARSLREILVAAGPFLKWMARGILAFSEWLKYATEAGRHSGDMAKFFDSARRSLKLLWGWLEPVGIGLWNIIKLGRPLGDTIQKDLGGAARQFQAWTESASGRNAIVKWFQDAKKPLYEMAHLVSDVGGVFLRLGANEGIADLVSQIRTELLPVLETLIGNTTENFGPHLVDALISVAKLLGTLGGSSGPLTVMVDIIGFLADALNGLFSTIPGSSQMTINILGMAGAFKLLKMISPAKAVEDLAKAMWKLVPAQARAAIVTRLYAISQWLLNAAFMGFPLVWIIAALAAVVVGLVVLWKKSETFRNIVYGVWNFLVGIFKWALDHWDILLAGMTGGMSILVRKVIEHRDEIVHAFRVLWDKAKSIFNTIKNGIVSAWEWVETRTEDVWYDIYSTIAGWVNKVIDVINKIPGVDIGHIDIGPSPAQVRATAGHAGPATGRAHGGVIAPRPGGIYRVAEAGKPEMVIPLDPALRDRAWSLMHQTASMLHGGKVIPSFRFGGVVDAAKSVGGAVKNAVGTGWDLLSGGAGALINLLPGMPNVAGDAGRIIGGALKWSREKVVAWIKDKIASIMPFGGQGGAVNMHGLVPQVLRALAYARSHGWGGSVVSGWRSYAQQAHLYALYKAGLGNIAAAPGTSSHEFGQAVDVSDYGTFGAIMAGAPANSRLYSRVAGDPVHFSVSGYRRGGLIGMRRGGEGVVRRPTAFLAGEGGPEAFSFRPLRNGGGAPSGRGLAGELTITNWETGRAVIRADVEAMQDARDSFTERRGRL